MLRNNEDLVNDVLKFTDVLDQERRHISDIEGINGENMESLKAL
jgi:hypothetical protein